MARNVRDLRLHWFCTLSYLIQFNICFELRDNMKTAIFRLDREGTMTVILPWSLLCSPEMLDIQSHLNTFIRFSAIPRQCNSANLR